jgi:hypothetical protein
MLPLAPPDRLHLGLQRTSEDVFEPEYASILPLVEFVAFEGRQRLFGWVRLDTDRLTDLLNAHDELLLTDVTVEDLDDGTTRSADEVLVRCRDLIAVHATGPRGDAARRRPTETHLVAGRAGAYLIGGRVHVPPGSDPIASVHERPAMIPLTEAWIEYPIRGRSATQGSVTIIVNRERLDWMRLEAEPDRPRDPRRGVAGGAR